MSKKYPYLTAPVARQVSQAIRKAVRKKWIWCDRQIYTRRHAWFRHCTESGVPCVCLEPAGRNTVDVSVTMPFHLKISDIGHEQLTRVLQGASHSGVWSATPGHFYGTDVHVGQAESLASALYDIAEEHAEARNQEADHA